MRRREVVALLGGGAVVWPLASGAEPPKRRRIAFLVTGTPLVGQPYLHTFRQDLHALGYSDDDLAFEVRFADRSTRGAPAPS